MSWIDKLLETYDLNAGAKGLIPLFHTEFNAQIIVSLKDGNFVGARVITDKKAQATIIPCTEASSARTSGRVPHPLFDSLMYIAGDLAEERYLAHLPEKERDKKCRVFRECSDLYLKQLHDWCASPHADPNVCVVEAYLNRKRLCADLIASGVFPTDEQGAIFLEKPKKEGNRELSEAECRAAEAPIYSAVTGDLSKAVVLFEIERCGSRHRPSPARWLSVLRHRSTAPSPVSFFFRDG